MTTPTRKRCAACNSRKSPESFFSNGRGGKRAECKACTRLQMEKRILDRVASTHIYDGAAERFVPKEDAQ